MKKYIFLLGTTPALSVAELQSVFASQELTIVNERAVLLQTQISQSPEEIINKLGGTIKIVELVDQLDKETVVADLESYLITYLSKHSQDKIKLAVSEQGRDQVEKIDIINIKRGLEKNGFKVRYLEGSGNGLGAAVLLHQKNVQEWYVVQGIEKVLIGKTVAVQDIDDWTKRDRGKPYSDRKKGMLPPKIARLMVNLAVGEKIWQENNESEYLYDPFCGTGTVLMEAAFAHFSLIGTDLDVRAILGTGENLAWLGEEYDLEVQDKLFTKDASGVKLADLSSKVNYLVTEPFLGKPTPKEHELAGIFRGLEKMYLGAFKNWTKLLAENAILTVVLPKVVWGKKEYNLHSFLDKIENLGYTRQSESELTYFRPQAVVQREIHVLKFNKKGN